MAVKKTAEPVEPDVVEAEVVDDEVVETAAPEPEELDAEVVESDAVVADATTEEAAADAATTPQREVIFVDAPTPPRKRGNRGLSVLLAIPATLIFLLLLLAVQYILSGGELDFVRQPAFYFPALFLFIGLVLLGLALNRSGWWSHIFGSVVVGAIVWFGSASLSLVSAGMLSMTQPQANEFFYAALFSPILIIAALLAREIAMWSGAVLARRGRTLKVRNADAYAAYEKEQAELLNTGR